MVSGIARSCLSARDFQTSHTATWSKHRHSAVLGLHQLPKPVMQTSGCHMKHCEHAVGSQARITSSAAYRLSNLQRDPHSGECPVGRCPSATVLALCCHTDLKQSWHPACWAWGACSSWRCVEKAYNPGQAVYSLLCVGGVLYVLCWKGLTLDIMHVVLNTNRNMSMLSNGLMKASTEYSIRQLIVMSMSC